jgi:hypothetical protein
VALVLVLLLLLLRRQWWWCCAKLYKPRRQPAAAAAAAALAAAGSPINLAGGCTATEGPGLLRMLCFSEAGPLRNASSLQLQHSAQHGILQRLCCH